MKAENLSNLIYFIALSVLFFSCSKGGSDTVVPPEEQNNLPAKPFGVLPTNGEPCADYEEVPNDNSEVLVQLRWNTAQFAENYILIIAEESTEVFRDTFSALETQVQLDRGKTYSWSLTAVNDAGDTPGDTYSFTTPGIPVSNFAPYAAEIEIIFNIPNLEMTISWTGNDEDGDVLVYDVEIIENGNLMDSFTDLLSTELTALPFIPGNLYEVRIKSRDDFGSTSISLFSQEAPE